MNHTHRGSLLLIVAGVLLLLAVVAYLIHDAETHSFHMEASAERQSLDAQTRQSIAEMKTLREMNDQMQLERQDLLDRNQEILESLKRFEALLGDRPMSRP